MGATRKQWTGQEKLRIVLLGISGKVGVANPSQTKFSETHSGNQSFARSKAQKSGERSISASLRPKLVNGHGCQPASDRYKNYCKSLGITQIFASVSELYNEEYPHYEYERWISSRTTVQIAQKA